MPIEEQCRYIFRFSAVSDKVVTEQIDWVGASQGPVKLGPWSCEWNDGLETYAALDNAIFV